MQTFMIGNIRNNSTSSCLKEAVCARILLLSTGDDYELQYNNLCQYDSTIAQLCVLTTGRTLINCIIIIIIFIYLPSDVISQEKTATSSRYITKASK